MPIVQDLNRITGDRTSVYRRPGVGRGTDGGDWLLDQRKMEAQAHQEMIEIQKECAAQRDIEGARFFKQEANWHRRRYNALLYIIPHYVNKWPGDCVANGTQPIEPWYWPLDLADEFDQILRAVDLH